MTKIRANFTVDKEVLTKFRKLCLDKGFNMSAKIEKAMNNILKSEKVVLKKY